MRRSQTSSGGLSSRRSLFPQNGGHSGFDLRRPTPSSSRPNSTAASVGRNLLDRPKFDQVCMPEMLLLDATFTASAAKSPVRRVCTDNTLKSCLSSSRVSMASMAAGSGSDAKDLNVITGSKSINKNEEFKLVRNVSFSHEQVREYEVTLGDNPSVRTGAPISLGWRYNPKESISSLNQPSDSHCNNPQDEFEGAGLTPSKLSLASLSLNSSSSSRNNKSINFFNSSPSSSNHMYNNNNNNNTQTNNHRVRRSRSELKLSDRERHRRLSANPNVSMQDLNEVLASIATTRLERKESLNEVREEMIAKKRAEMQERMKQRGSLVKLQF